MIVVRLLRFLFISLPFIAVLSIFWPIASLVLWISGGSPEKQFELGRWWAKALLNLAFIKVRYIGLNHFASVRRCVLICNHSSVLDIPVLYDIPVEYCFVVAKQLFYNPFLCIQLRTAHQIPVGGNPGKDSMKSVRRAVRLITNTGKSVLIFPEIYHLSARLKPFQQGAALIAIQAGVPVVPIALTGTRQFLGGTVVVRIGEPIHARELDRALLTKHLHNRMAELLMSSRGDAQNDAAHNNAMNSG